MFISHMKYDVLQPPARSVLCVHMAYLMAHPHRTRPRNEVTGTKGAMRRVFAEWKGADRAYRTIW